MEEKETLQKIEKLLGEMLSTEPAVLTAALALLPEQSMQAAMSVLRAAAQIGAEHYEDTDVFLEAFRNLVLQTKDDIARAAAKNT